MSQASAMEAAANVLATERNGEVIRRAQVAGVPECWKDYAAEKRFLRCHIRKLHRIGQYTWALRVQSRLDRLHRPNGWDAARWRRYLRRETEVLGGILQ